MRADDESFNFANLGKYIILRGISLHPHYFMYNAAFSRRNLRKANQTKMCTTQNVHVYSYGCVQCETQFLVTFVKHWANL